MLIRKQEARHPAVGRLGWMAALLLALSATLPAQQLAIGGYPVNEYLNGITAGPDGALWFTETVAETVGQIGRITTAGVVTEYPLPTVNSLPAGITAGPDGALWFTEGGSNRIGRITTGGVITEYPVPTPVSSPAGITAGPDGARGLQKPPRGARSGASPPKVRSPPVPGPLGSRRGRMARCGLPNSPATRSGALPLPG